MEHGLLPSGPGGGLSVVPESSPLVQGLRTALHPGD